MRTLLFATALLLSFTTLALANPPAMLARQAAEIAQADLESRGLQGTVFIEQINYKKGGGISGDPAYWEILWNKPFPAQTKGRDEIGLRITMDGNYKRSVK
ncbi:MAG: hypothetical protein MI807_00170 [Verrucomicrobiales bacterium]|nr:hypothetical protein [Verrucomicrobiales bacterium]